MRGAPKFFFVYKWCTVHQNLTTAVYKFCILQLLILVHGTTFVHCTALVDIHLNWSCVQYLKLWLLQTPKQVKTDKLDPDGSIQRKKSVDASHAVSRSVENYYAVVQNDQKPAWHCTKVLLDLNSCTRLACGSPMYKIEALLFKPCWLDHFVHCIGFLYFRGKLHVTSQQIYSSGRCPAT